MLAGSATASTASVVLGAKALAGVVGSAGVAAGASMIADNISQAAEKLPQVFWSGGDLAKNTARQLANDIGGHTLEMTRLGARLEQMDVPFSAWQAASANFANVATNTSPLVYSIQNAAGINIQSVWATVEYPILQSSNIIYSMVTQDGAIVFMP